MKFSINLLNLLTKVIIGCVVTQSKPKRFVINVARIIV